MILELLQNVALLVTLSVGLQLLAQRIDRPGLLYPLAAGALFGAVGVVAMMTPLEFVPGVIYDGRSIIVSLAGFIGGPVTATVAALMCAAYRLYLGGAGAVVGVLVVIESALFGVAFYYLRRRNPRWERPVWLWLFGVVVQSVMLLLQLLLPGRLGWQVVPQIAPSVLIFYPLGFMVAALVFLENERRRALEKMVAAHNRVLEMVAARVPLPTVLSALMHELEAQAPEMAASVLLFDEDRQRLQHVAAPSLPTALCAAVDAALVDNPTQAIYAAASQRQRVITRNIATAPEWEGLREIVLTHGLRAGWSAPIFDPASHVIGIFALYYRKPVTPTAFHLKLVEQAIQVAAIAVTRHHQEEALRTERDFARQVMDAMGEGLSVTDANGRLSYVNSALAQMVGSTPAAMLGRNPADYVVDDDYQVLMRVVEGRRQSNRSVYELRLQHSAGQTTPVLVSGTPRVRRGQYQGAIAVVTDLTERKRVEEALRESEARYRLLVDSSPYAIGIYQEARLVFVNRAAVQLLGANAPADLLGATLEQVVAPEDQLQVQARISRMLQGEPGLYPAQNTYVRRDGSRVPVEVVAVPFTVDGRPAVQVLAQDITDRVRRQLELEAQALLAQALSETDDLDHLLARILEASIHAVAAAKKGSLMLADAAGRLHIRALSGYHDPRSFTVQFPSEFGYGWRAYRQRRPLLINDVRADPEIAYVGEIEEVAAVQSALVVPLVVAGEVIGVMALDNTERKAAFDEHDLRVFTNIAATASLVLERARLFEEVRLQARQLAQIMETAPQGLILMSSAGRVLMANPLGARDLMTLAAAQVGDIITQLGDQPLAALLTVPSVDPWHEAHADNRIFELIARPVLADGAPEQWVVVIDDVTWSRRKRAQEQLQERLATVGQLAAGIAHDFNNILQIILLHAQITALSTATTAEDRRRMEIIVDQAQNATNLIRQILDFSRQSVLERHPVDLLALLNDQVKLLRRTLPESISISLDHAIPCEDSAHMVNADPTRLRQAVMNLAINARDAMPDGGALRFELAYLTVTPTTPIPAPGVTPGDWVRLTVTDTGMGISPDVQPHIFDPFFTTKAPGKGTGLGLAQVHGIVTQHDGHITVASVVGQGAEFAIYLPALPATQITAIAPATNVAQGGHGERLLLVEDNPALRVAMADLLASLNYTVVDVANGSEALERLAADDAFALVLSDVVMPDIGGVALVQALRAQGATVPVILMSGHPRDQELAALRQLGVAAWLPKPCPLVQLAQTIGAVLSP